MQENIIEVKNLTKRFKNFVAVDDVSFDVKKGEIFGFLGPNGAGKSTTIRMLATLLRPTSGKVMIAGFDIVKEANKVRRKIGLVAEKIIIYDRLTAMENLEFFGRLNHLPPNVIKERSQKWLERLHMEEWKNHLIGTFSTGMKQRINLIRELNKKVSIQSFKKEPRHAELVSASIPYLVSQIPKQVRDDEGTECIRYFREEPPDNLSFL